MPQEKKHKFTEGEKVLCFHGPLLYEAQIKGQLRDKITKYLVHYAGWNKNWDEWVADSRVLKYNDENLKKQKDLKLQYANPTRQLNVNQPLTTTNKSISIPPYVSPKPPQGPSKNTVQITPAKTPQGTSKSAAANLRASKRAKKRGIEVGKTGDPEKREIIDLQPKRKRGRVGTPSSESESSRSIKLEVRVSIPQDLRRFLLDDSDFVIRQKQLVPLPKPFEKSVKGILKDYMTQRLRHAGGIKEGVLEEVTKGISEYFDVMLGTQLLYKFERPQYSDLMKEFPGKPMAEMYGSEHLLRLFVKIGNVLSFANFDDKSLGFVINYIYDFLDWMIRKSDELFSSEYESATPDYYRRAST